MFRNCILFGYKSSGKTFFGSLLAKELNYLFIDTDQQIEALYQKEFKKNDNCRQIASDIGEEGFRNLERRVIANLKDTDQAIIALGGGAILDQQNYQTLKALGKLIYLEEEKETLKQRIFSYGIPAFFDSSDPEASFENMYTERKAQYEKASTLRVTLHKKTHRQILDELKVLISL